MDSGRRGDRRITWYCCLTIQGIGSGTPVPVSLASAPTTSVTQVPARGWWDSLRLLLLTLLLWGPGRQGPLMQA